MSTTAAGVLKALQRTSLIRTAYRSLQAGGSCMVLRGTRLRLGQGARLDLLAPKAILVLGINRAVPTPASVHLMERAVLVIRGTVELARGVRVLVGEGATLEIGGNTFINPGTTINCLEHVSIGFGCAISWGVNIFDFNGHPLTVNGEGRSISRPVHIGEHVWLGAGVTVLSGVTIGDGAVIGAGSLVTKSVPAGSLVAGYPAQIISEDVQWAL